MPMSSSLPHSFQETIVTGNNKYMYYSLNKLPKYKVLLNARLNTKHTNTAKCTDVPRTTKLSNLMSRIFLSL